MQALLKTPVTHGGSARPSVSSPDDRDATPRRPSHTRAFGKIVQRVAAILKNPKGRRQARVLDEPQELRSRNQYRDRHVGALRRNAESQQLGQRSGVGIGNIRKIQEYGARVLRERERIAHLAFAADLELAGQPYRFDRLTLVHARPFPIAAIAVVWLLCSKIAARPSVLWAKRSVKIATSSAALRSLKIRERIAVAILGGDACAADSTASSSSFSPATTSRECSIAPSV